MSEKVSKLYLKFFSSVARDDLRFVASRIFFPSLYACIAKRRTESRTDTNLKSSLATDEKTFFCNQFLNLYHLTHFFTGGLKGLEYLVELDLSNNYIDALNGLSACPRLVSLNLSSNRIVTIKNLVSKILNIQIT